MKKLFSIKLIIFLVLILLFINGCANTSTLTSTSTQTPSATLIPTLTATLSPTLTPTPVPVTIQEAIQRGTFAELEVFNKGHIEYHAGRGIVRNSMFSPDGNQFLAFTTHGVYIYDVGSWQELFSIPFSPGVSITSITAINYSLDGYLLAVGDSRGVVTFWNTQTWQVQNSFQLQNRAITSLDISPDNLNFATIQDERIISIWDMEDGNLLKSQTRNRNAGPVYYSSDGKWLYIPEIQQDINVWNSKELTLIERVTWLGKISSDENMRASVRWDGPQSLIVTLYDLNTEETAKLEFTLEEWENWGHFNDVTNTMFLDEKTLMVKLEHFENYYLIDAESQSISAVPPGDLDEVEFKNPEFIRILKSDEIKALGFEELGDIKNITPDGTALILSDYFEIPGGVFDLNQKTMKKDTIQEFTWDSSVFLSDGSLAGVDWTRPIRNPPFSNKKQQGDFVVTILDESFFVKSKIELPYDFPDYIDTATISPNGKFLAAGTADGNLYLWDLKSKELITTIRAHNKVVEQFGFYGAYFRLLFDHDGSHLATWGQDLQIKIFSMDDQSEDFSVYGEHPIFSPDGNYLAYFSSNGFQTVYSSDGDILGYSRPGYIRVISLNDAEESNKVFKENSTSVYGMAFSSDGSLLFSSNWSLAERKSTLQIWSVADGTLLEEILQHDVIRSLLVSPDGTRLYMRTSDGVISAWGHDPEKE